MEELFDEEEAKGRYCRFVRTADGKMTLKPVKVPAHIKREREERIRRRELQQRIARNRARAQVLNVRFVLFLGFVMAVCCLACYVYLSMRSEVAARLDTIAGLQSRVEEMASDNDLAEKRMDGQFNLEDTKEKAVQQFGMQEVSPKQIVYYSVDEADFMVQYDEIQK